MFWSCFAASGTGCLEVVTIKAFWNNSPVSSSKIMTPNTIKRHSRVDEKKMLDHSEAMNPDLNPIEHLWKEPKLAVGRLHPSNLRELEQFANEEWVKLPVKKCRNFIQSYRKSLAAVMASKGCATTCQVNGANIFGHDIFICFYCVSKYVML